MIRVDLSQAKMTANLLKSSAEKKSNVIGSSFKVLPSIVIGTAITADTLTTSKSKEKSGDVPCAFWECTL